MDEADRASQQEEANLADALRRSTKPAGPKPTGYCLFCDEPLCERLRWCPGMDCRERYERERRLRR